MQKKMSRSVAASAFVVPAIFAGVLIGPSPANAATITTHPNGICNGVVNQLAHRGTVQENLLKAAARKNTELITKMQADRAALVTQADTLTKQIADSNAKIAALNTADAELDSQISDANSELSTLTAAQTAKATEIANAKAEIAGYKKTADGL